MGGSAQQLGQSGFVGVGRREPDDAVGVPASGQLLGERVDRAVLSDGAELRVGKFRLNFFVSPLDRAPATGA